MKGPGDSCNRLQLGNLGKLVPEIRVTRTALSFDGIFGLQVACATSLVDCCSLFILSPVLPRTKSATCCQSLCWSQNPEKAAGKGSVWTPVSSFLATEPCLTTGCTEVEENEVRYRVEERRGRKQRAFRNKPMS